MRHRFFGAWVLSGTLAATLAATPVGAGAAVQLTGCAGGSFANACGLDELIAGGSMVVDGYSFSNFVLGLNGGRILDASAIRVDAIDSASGPGFTLVDVGNTLRAGNGVLSSNNVGFDIAALAGQPLIVGAALSLGVGDVSGSGSYATAFADLFNPTFTTFYGNMTTLCDVASCSGSTLSSQATFAAAGALSVVGGIDVSAATGGVGEINTVALVLVPAPVPEPATLSLLAVGLGAMAYRRRRRVTTP